MFVRVEVVRGWSGAAGEVGHLPLVLDGRSCECGSQGCWEKYASGSALILTAAQAGWQSSTAGPDILAAAEAGDARATGVVRSVAAHLVHGIRILSAAIDPGLVILGGGLGSDVRFVRFVNEAEQHQPVTPPRSHAPIRAATLGPYAGVIGAGDLARLRK